ncbi:MAG: thioredoxin domain-containing protein [Solirubrobacteraceae bacterium]
MPNRLAEETSPYLLQHKDNPVDWHAWGDEALALASAEQRPLLVSIGYSACHWCHVMERESFEDPAIAALMNERFVCVKVDREERPDVDAVCMEACQAMTGQGGWPLNAFLTPEQAPFYVGTYFPLESRHGLPSWRAVLEAVASAWDERREDVRRSGAQVLQSIGASARMRASEEPITEQLLLDAVESLRGSYDGQQGGFARAPKFPMSSAIEFLLVRGETGMSLHTLRCMAKGGIYDQVGGGFSRYSVDANWTVPHFEKMLYDNALLARAYLHGWLVSGEPRLKSVCCETLDWALREMRGPEGGFCSALDADSEGAEGKFYVWTVDELRRALGGESLAQEAIAYFGATEAGNFEGATNVLQAHGPEPERLPEIRCQLYGARSERVRPGRDDKRLTSWNALMISALADAGGALAREDYVAAAVQCAEFLLAELRDPGGGLLRTWKDGRAHIGAYLDDYAYLVQALTALYEATFDPRWYREAVGLADVMIERFADIERGGFFTTVEDQRQRFPRRKDLEDSPIPSGSSAAAYGLLRLALLSGEAEYERQALGVLRLLAPIAGRHPLAFGHALQAFDFYLARTREVAVVGGADADELVAVVRGEYRPHVVLAGGNPDGVPLLQGRTAIDGRAAAYVCEHFSCRAPVTSAEELAAALAAQSTGR